MCWPFFESDQEVVLHIQFVLDSGHEVHVQSSGLGKVVLHVCEEALGPRDCWGDASQQPQDISTIMLRHVVFRKGIASKDLHTLTCHLWGRRRNCTMVSMFHLKMVFFIDQAKYPFLSFFGGMGYFLWVSATVFRWITG